MWDFAKNQVVESLDSVPEKYRGLYAEVTEGENQGKFQIMESVKGLVGDYVSAAKSLGEERGKVSKLNEENQNRRQAAAAYSEIFEDLGIEDSEENRTPEKMKEAIQALRDKKGQAAQADIERIREEMNRKHQADLQAKDKEIEERDTAISRHLIGDNAVRAITENKGSVKALLPHVRQNCKTVRDENGNYAVRIYDEQGNMRYGGGGEPLTMAELVQEFKSDENFAALFESETPSGSGMRPGAGQQQSGPSKPNTSEMNPTQKIASGLNKGLYQQGGRGQAA